MTIYVLDAFAMLAVLSDEPGADVVEYVYEKAASGEAILTINKLNLLEVYYDDLFRSYGKERADEICNEIRRLPIQIFHEISDEVFMEAGRLKASYKISLADNENKGIYEATKKSPVIIFDDFTTSCHWVDFSFKVKSSAMKILTNNNKSVANFRYLYYAIRRIKYKPDFSKHERQWIGKYSQMLIPLPSFYEQSRIVSILERFDALTNDISSGMPAEIATRQKQYEYYRDKLLTFRGDNVPRMKE